MTTKKKLLDNIKELNLNKSELEEILKDNKTIKKIKAISLFSGAGGDSLGMKMSNIEVVGYVEKEKIFQKTHDVNLKECKCIGEDITKISDEEFKKYKNKIDIIFSGFPCQSFSSAGKRKEDDIRNTLFKEFVRATKIINPKIIIGENVKGLLTKKTKEKKLYIDIICEEFKELGYKVEYKVLKTDEHEIPQYRERLIIIGVKEGVMKENKIIFPEKNNIKQNLKDIIEFNMYGAKKINKDIYDMSNIPEECIICDDENEEEENNIHPYLISKINTTNKTYDNKTYESLFSFSKRISPIHCEIIDIRKPCKTIICSYNNQPRLFIPLKNKNGYYLRCLLPKELQQIQGFPKEYEFNGNSKNQIIQIGNAVPPILIKKICDCLLNNIIT
jgi:DNA (cytosine-5)-methyltransferase 1